MSIQPQRAILLFSLFLISCLLSHPQLRTGVTNRPPDYDSLGGFPSALERVSEAAQAAPQSELPSSGVGCSSVADAGEPRPMRILFHGYVDGQWRTYLGMVSSQGLSAVTDLTPSYGTTELSHDGESVAYVTCGVPDPAIYILGLTTSERWKVIPLGRVAYCPSVRWSFDDRMLSYESTTDYALHIVSVDGSNHIRLPATVRVGWHSWSPSGKEIVFETGHGGLRSLRIMDLHGNVRELTHLGDFNNCETWAPDWSPDGTRISFESCGRVFTVSPQGADVQQLASGASGAYSPRWSADGQWIFFLSKSVLMRVRRDGQCLSRVADLPPPYSGSSPFSLGMLQ
jgi:hypothetical protein